MTSTGVAIVLPARYESTRFPGKPLAMLAGKPLIEWVYARAQRVGGVSRVVVATDDRRIADAVSSFGGDVVMTAIDHATGTDRVAEVARSLDEDIVVNLQGDEPVFPIALIREMIDHVGAGCDIVTAAHPIVARAEIDNPNVVKVVVTPDGNALYFSRSAIPCSAHRGKDASNAHEYLRHVGVYVFERSKLIAFSEAPRTPLEIAEGLEQLRALEMGMTIRVVKTEETTLGVDVPEDIKSVEKVLSAT